jgi:hypothetical protein
MRPGIGSASVKLSLKMVWKPVKVYFAAAIEKLEKATDDVVQEADIAEKEQASIARKKVDARDQCELSESLIVVIKGHSRLTRLEAWDVTNIIQS